MDKEIENYLNQNYLMIRKNRFYYVLGGAVVMIIAILGLSIRTMNETVKSTLKDLQIIGTATALKEMREQAQDDYVKISAILNDIKDKRLFSIGYVKDNEEVRAPSGTTTDDWDIFLIPCKIGNIRKGYEANDALLLYESKCDAKSDKTGWNVQVYHMYKYVNQSTKESWGAPYILLRKVYSMNYTRR